jgi:hypothetical protein
MGRGLAKGIRIGCGATVVAGPTGKLSRDKELKLAGSTVLGLAFVYALVLGIAGPPAGVRGS